ncbi:MAG: septum formation initiator family protein [Chloroflexota bacterium]|jgi:cell division protein FtsB|nr:septum formation initiator family protein [Anaerolineae bacterium]HMM29336.1 septum formation initiator family protein [Aggregatilineaceae bacterium]
MTDSELSAAPDASGPATPRRKPRQQLSSMQIVFAAILSIGLLLVINLSGRIARGQQMDAERARLQATISVLEAQQIELRKERDYAESDAKVEQWAHSDGKMVREGEVLVIPIPGREPEITPTATPPAALVRAAAEEDKEPSWHLWWQLFFEGDPPF